MVMWKSSEAGSFNEGAGWLLQGTAIARRSHDSIARSLVGGPYLSHNPMKLGRGGGLAIRNAAGAADVWLAREADGSSRSPRP
jgi:hypothetical protein